MGLSEAFQRGGRGVVPAQRCPAPGFWVGCGWRDYSSAHLGPCGTKRPGEEEVQRVSPRLWGCCPDCSLMAWPGSASRFRIPVPGSASGWRPGQRLGGERSSWPERSKFPDPPAGISSSGPQFIWGPCLRDTLAFQPRALTFDAAVSVSGAEDGTSEPLVVLSLAFSTHLWNSRKMFTMSPS